MPGPKQPDKPAADDSAAPETDADDTPASAAREADADDSGDGESDDVRRKFRESLQRKHKQQSDHLTAEGSKTTSKVHEGFGPQRGRRSFRRKSG